MSSVTALIAAVRNVHHMQSMLFYRTVCAYVVYFFIPFLRNWACDCLYISWTQTTYSV